MNIRRPIQHRYSRGSGPSGLAKVMADRDASRYDGSRTHGSRTNRPLAQRPKVIICC